MPYYGQRLVNQPQTSALDDMTAPVVRDAIAKPENYCLKVFVPLNYSMTPFHFEKFESCHFKLSDQILILN